MESCKPKKYIDGYLEKKESSKWVAYWAVLQGNQLVFYRDQNTHITENITSYVDIGCYSSCTKKSSKANKFDFELKTKGGKKHQLRASSDLLRLQWLHALGCAAQGKPIADFSGEEELHSDEQHTESETFVDTNQKPTNHYSEVPSFNMGSSIASGMNDKDMQKEIDMKKPHMPTFVTHGKKMWGKKKPLSFDSACSQRPQTEGAEAAEPFYNAVPLDDPPWYVGKITREKAEDLLQKCAVGTFLVRDSESVQKAGAYTLTLKHSQNVRHHKIETLSDGELVIKGHENKPFPNLATLMKYFARSQAHEINLIPYIEEKEEGTPSKTNYERMNSPRLPPKPAEPTMLPKHSYQNLPDKNKAPPPIIRTDTTPVLRGYENLPSKDKKPLTKTRSNPYNHGYENLPTKDPPPLPPGHDVPHGYENLPSKSPKAHTLATDVPPVPPRSSLSPVRGYQNLPPAAAAAAPSFTGKLPPYQNVPPKVPPRSITRASTLPAHLMEETLRNSGF